MLAASVLSPAMRSDTTPDRPDVSWGDQKTLSRRPGPSSVLFSAAARTPRVKPSTRNVERQLLPRSLVRSHSAHSVCWTTKIRERNPDVMSELWAFVKFITRSDRSETTVDDLRPPSAGK